MRIQLTEKFWNKVNDHQEKVKGALVENDFLTYDQLCYVTAGEDMDEEFEATPYLIFRSNVRYDRHDFPEEKKVYLDDETYFDTQLFDVIEREDKERLEILERQQGNLVDDNQLIERDIPRELIWKLATTLEDSYLGKIDEECTYLDPSIKSILNDVIQYKRDYEYSGLDILDKIRMLIKEYDEDSKKCQSSVEFDSVQRTTFRRILSELVDFGFIDVVKQEWNLPIPKDVDFPSLEKRVIDDLVVRFNNYGHSEEQ